MSELMKPVDEIIQNNLLHSIIGESIKENLLPQYLSQHKKQILFKIFIISQFNYCTLV